MKYIFLIYEDESFYGAEKNNAALHEIVARHMSFSESLGAARLGGAGLKATRTATTVRAQDTGTTAADRTIHDGPFAETKEQLGGFYLVEAPDLDAALALARKVPLRGPGAVEVRPLMGQD